MSQTAPGAQSLAEKARLQKVWNARPEVQAMTAEVGAALAAEGASWDVAGFNRAFALMNEFEARNGHLPPSGIEANG